MNKKLKNYMYIMASIFSVLAIVCSYVYIYSRIGIMEIFSIIFLTCAFHFIIRIIIGNIIPFWRKKLNYKSKWFKEKKFEKKIYKILKVKNWRSKVNKYDLKEFSDKNNTLQEFVINMCNSELVHQFNMVFSYLPLILANYFGKFYVFLVTSIIASLIDLRFIIIQRYNRPRFVKLLEKKKELQL